MDERTAALSIAKEAAEAASRSKSIFIANLSHELRTPMNGILGMINLAKRRVIDPKAIDYLDKANIAANNLLSLINDLLDIANIEGERLTLEKSPFRIRDILKNVDTLSREKLPGRVWNISPILTQGSPNKFSWVTRYACLKSYSTLPVMP